MRRLHITLIVEPVTLPKEWKCKQWHICPEESTCNIVREAELVGVEVRFTLEILGCVEPMVNSVENSVDISILRNILPPNYESRTTVRQAGVPI